MATDLMAAPRGAAARAADPAGARLAFYVVGDNGACTRFLLCFVVIATTLGALAVFAPAAATILGSLLLTAAGGRGAMRWWRGRSQQRSPEHRRPLASSRTSFDNADQGR